jgi:DNA-binding NarL/FixJ family response regulator
MMNQDSPEQKKQKILVVDDHELMLGGTLNVLKQRFPVAEICTAKTAEEVSKQLQNFEPDLVILDLQIPEKTGTRAQIETGIQLLEKLLKQYPTLNLMVQSANVKHLVRLKQDIDNHEGGFTITDKAIAEAEMLTRADWAMQGLTHTKDLKLRIEIKPDWLKVLELAAEGLTDKAIANKIHMSERTVRIYWTKVQDALDVYPDEGISLRVLTLKRAREEGLIN